MMLDQPGNELCFIFIQTQARTGHSGILRALNTLIALAFARVMQQHSQMQGSTVGNLRRKTADQWVIDGVFAQLDLTQQTQGVERMLIHSEAVIHVELGARHDMTELRDIDP